MTDKEKAKAYDLLFERTDALGYPTINDAIDRLVELTPESRDGNPGDDE